MKYLTSIVALCLMLSDSAVILGQEYNREAILTVGSCYGNMYSIVMNESSHRELQLPVNIALDFVSKEK